MELLIGLAALAGLGWWLGRREQRKAPSRTSTEQPAVRQASAPARPRTQPVAQAGARREAGRRGRQDVRWVPLGTPVTVQGLTLTGGLYVGTGLAPVSGYGGAEPALVDPTLPVDLRRPDVEGRQMGYWPSYTEIPPASRGGYLRWLEAGRPAGAYIGYVFLFFYGIERRIFHDEDSAEAPALLAEVERLLALYGGTGSFQGYAGEFLAAARLLGEGRSVAELVPPRERIGWDVPLEVRVAAGALAGAGEPLPAEWALGWAVNSPEIPLRTPATRCTEEFAELFITRYSAAYGDGLRIKPNKTMLRLQYRPASASFGGRQIALSADGVPDVTRLTGPTKKLAALVAEVTDALDGYSRHVGRHADRESARAVALLPPELARDRLPASGARLLEQVPADGLVVVATDELAGLLGASGKLPKRDAAAVAALLAGHGVAIEPDVRVGAANFSHHRQAVLWSDNDASASAGDGFGAATVLLHLSVTVSASDGDVSVAEEQHLEAELETAFDLSATARRRLRAHLRWLLAERPGVAGLKARVGALAPPQRQLIAKYLLAVAGADGHVSPQEIDTLRRLYGLLGLDPDTVHRDIHGLAAPSAPTSVIGADADQGAFAVPGRVMLDERRLADVLSSTQQVAAVLDSVFAGEPEADPEPASDPEDDAGEPDASIAGLDLHHTALVHRLASRPAWRRADFDALAGELALLPAGAVETINHAAFSVADALLLEGDDPIELDGDVLKEMLDA
jgi:uncharacterized tellurite resistance protein B-like protein